MATKLNEKKDSFREYMGMFQYAQKMVCKGVARTRREVLALRLPARVAAVRTLRA